jgi:hypothetical protein
MLTKVKVQEFLKEIEVDDLVKNLQIRMKFISI